MTIAGEEGEDRERRNARIYLTGLGVSLIGNNAMTLVAGIWVKELTGSSSAAALVSVCIYAPSLLAPVSGVLADRYRSRQLLMSIYAISAVALLALLLVRSVGDIWLIYLVMFGYGCSLDLAGPAESAMFTRMFTPQRRQQMNGFSLSLQEAGRLVAPLAGAAIFATLGGGAVAAVDAATFVAAVWATYLLRVDDVRPPRSAIPWRANLASGMRHIRATPQLKSVVILAGIAIAMSGVVVPAQYSLVAALHRSPSFLGVLSAVLGAGSIVGGMVSGRLISRIGEFNLAALGAVNYAIGNVLKATGHLLPALIGMAVLGFALPWCLIASITIGQRLTRPELQGRVSAAISLALFAPQPIVQAIGAGLSTFVDFRILYVVFGVIPLFVLFALVARRPEPGNGPPRAATGP